MRISKKQRIFDRPIKTGINIFFSVFMVILFSCQIAEKKQDSDIKSFLGSTLFIPQSMETEFNKYVNSSENLLVIIIESEDCHECALNNFNMLKYYDKDFSTYKTNILLITERENREEITMLLKNKSINYPVIFDDNHEFVNKNKFMKNPLFYTFVINNKKEIVWIGSPITDKRTWDLFCKQMQKNKR